MYGREACFRLVAQRWMRLFPAATRLTVLEVNVSSGYLRPTANRDCTNYDSAVSRRVRETMAFEALLASLELEITAKR